MTDDLDPLLGRLDLVRRSPHGFMARCPAHADRTPSLSIRLIDGKVSAHCFGCGAGTRDLYHALGLPWHGGPAEALSPFNTALAMGRQQQGQRHRERNANLDHARAARREAAELRRAATLMGDTEEAWDALAEAAEWERLACVAEMAA